MELFVRFTLYVTLLAGAVVGAAYCQPSWLASLGLDFWSLPELEQVVSESRERSEQLDDARQKMQDNAVRKKLIVQNLAEGRVTLAEALGAVLELDEAHYLQVGAESLGIASDNLEETTCRLLIYWTDERLAADPEAAAAARVRLQQEFEEILNIAE